MGLPKRGLCPAPALGLARGIYHRSRVMKNYLKIASIPVTLLVFSLIYNLLWIVFKLPKNDELVAIVGKFLDHYGLWVVFVSAFIEGVLIAGNYFPGGLVIFSGCTGFWT